MTTEPNHDLDQWLETATKNLPAGISQTVCAEIEAHYADTVAEHQAQGKSPAEAHQAALAALGDVQATARALRDTHLAHRRYLAVSLVSLIWPIYPMLYFSLMPVLGIPASIQLVLYYAGICFIILLGLHTLKTLLNRRFQSGHLNQPITMITWGLSAYLGSVLLAELLFSGLSPTEIYAPEAEPLLKGLAYGIISGAVVAGSGALWLTTRLARITEPIFGLRLALTLFMAVFGLGFISFGLSLAANIKLLADLSFVLFMCASFFVFALLSLIFFRAARRPTNWPAPVT